MKGIEVKNIEVKYTSSVAPVLTNVNFNIKLGNIVGIIGPNGAGKSTLMNVMLGLIKPSTGDVYFGDKKISSIRKQIAYVKQKVDQDLNFPIRVRDVVMMGLYHDMGVIKKPNKLHKEKVEQALESVEMSPFANRQISELSGGQLQRVFIARVIVQNADYIFLDEPFTGIDVDSEEKIIKILKGLKAQGKTILMVHHDLSKVSAYFDEVVILKKEVIAYGGVEETFTKENLIRAFDNPLMHIFREDGTND